MCRGVLLLPVDLRTPPWAVACPSREEASAAWLGQLPTGWPPPRWENTSERPLRVGEPGTGWGSMAAQQGLRGVLWGDRKGRLQGGRAAAPGWQVEGVTALAQMAMGWLGCGQGEHSRGQLLGQGIWKYEAQEEAEAGGSRVPVAPGAPPGAS